MEVEIGRGKKGRRAFGFDDIAIVPSRRTRDPDDIDIASMIGPYRLEVPLLAFAMDGLVSPETAGILGKHYEGRLEPGQEIAATQRTLVSAENVSANAEPLNLKDFIREVPVPVIVG